MLYISPIDFEDVPLDISKIDTPHFIVVYRTLEGSLGFGRDETSFEFTKRLLNQGLFWNIKLNKWELLNDKTINFYRYDMSGVIFLTPIKSLVEKEKKSSEDYVFIEKKHEILKKRRQNTLPPSIPDFLSIYSPVSKKYDARILNLFLEVSQPLIIWDWGYFKGYFICLDTPDYRLKNSIKEQCLSLDIKMLEVKGIQEIPED